MYYPTCTISSPQSLWDHLGYLISFEIQIVLIRRIWITWERKVEWMLWIFTCFSRHWSVGSQGRKTRKATRERKEYKPRKKVTLKKRWGCGLERLRLQEGRTEYRVKKDLKEEIGQKETKEKYEGEKGTGKERRINGKTRKAVRVRTKYLGKTNTVQWKGEDRRSEKKKHRANPKKLMALQYLCSQGICIQST